MRGIPALALSAALAAPCHPAVAEQAKRAGEGRIQLEVDASEAEAVLAVLDAQKTGANVDEAAWRRIFSSEPYVRLKKREASLHRDFTDDDFRTFVLSGDLARRAPDLRRTLDAWAKGTSSRRPGASFRTFRRKRSSVPGSIS